MLNKTTYGLIGVKKKARIDHICLGCGNKIHKGEYYDYSDGWSATFLDDNGESKRNYYQCKFHLECTEITYLENESITLNIL